MNNPSCAISIGHLNTLTLLKKISDTTKEVLGTPSTYSNQVNDLLDLLSGYVGREEKWRATVAVASLGTCKRVVGTIILGVEDDIRTTLASYTRISFSNRFFTAA